MASVKRKQYILQTKLNNMAKFLTTTGIASEIENAIRNTQQWLVLVSPYLQFSQNFVERLRDADRKNVMIYIVYRSENLGLEQANLLTDIKNLKLYHCNNLHAKCYMNEQCGIITSMNLYEYSEKKNREIGVLYSINEDKNIYDEAYAEIKSIIGNSNAINLHSIIEGKQPIIPPKLVEPTFPVKNVKSESKQTSLGQILGSIVGGISSVTTNLILNKEGYCLRCGDKIKYGLDKPLCSSCYQLWAIYSNEDYQETYCHTCGKKSRTSMAKPECKNCYKR